MMRIDRRTSLTGLCIVVVAVGCQRRDNEYVPPPPPQVSVARPEKKNVPEYLELTGNIQAYEVADLRARVEGYLVAQHFKDGDYVKKGDLLFTIEPEPYEARLKLEESTVAAMQAKLTQAKLEYDRQVQLVRQSATSQADVEKWQAMRDEAQSTLMAAQARSEIAKIDLGYTKVTAPFDGRMDRRLKDPGNLVGAQEATLLSTITRLDPIYAYFTINERDLVEVMAKLRKSGLKKLNEAAVKATFGIAGEEGFPHEGTLDFTATSLDSGTGTILVRAVVPNPREADVPRLLPGMFVKVRLPVDERPDALLVPERSLAADQGGRYLLVVNDKDVVQQRPVKVGQAVGDLRVISEGLQGDEWIVTSGIQRARPGAKVTPMRQGPVSDSVPRPATGPIEPNPASVPSAGKA